MRPLDTSLQIYFTLPLVLKTFVAGLEILVLGTEVNEVETIGQLVVGGCATTTCANRPKNKKRNWGGRPGKWRLDAITAINLHNLGYDKVLI